MALLVLFAGVLAAKASGRAVSDQRHLTIYKVPFDVLELMTAGFRTAKQPTRYTDDYDYSEAVGILAKDLF